MGQRFCDLLVQASAVLVGAFIVSNDVIASVLRFNHVLVSFLLQCDLLLSRVVERVKHRQVLLL
jgi:hypothetical protein